MAGIKRRRHNVDAITVTRLTTQAAGACVCSAFRLFACLLVCLFICMQWPAFVALSNYKRRP